MLVFEMPKSGGNEKEKIRRERFEKALNAAGIIIEDGKFFLDIEKGEILTIVNNEIGFENLHRDLKFGCTARIPYIEYYHGVNGRKMMYVRMLNADVSRKNFYMKKNGEEIPKPDVISMALSIPSNYSESLSIRANEIKATVLSDKEGWKFYFNGCGITDGKMEEEGLGLKDAIYLMLDFYKSKNL